MKCQLLIKNVLLCPGQIPHWNRDDAFYFIVLLFMYQEVLVWENWFFFFSLKPEFPSCLSKAGVTGRYMVYISQGYKRQAFSILFPSSYPAPLHDMILGSEFWKNVRCSQPIRGYQLYPVSQSTDVIDEPERHPCFTEYNEMGRFLSYLSCSIRFYLYWHFLIGDPMVVLEYGFDC